MVIPHDAVCSNASIFYELDNPVWFPAGAEFLLAPLRPDRHAEHAASYPAAGDSFPWGKRA
jgi:hypothetical protein